MRVPGYSAFGIERTQNQGREKNTVETVRNRRAGPCIETDFELQHSLAAGLAAPRL